MKTGIISDGSAEAVALEHLVVKMKCGGFTPLRPVYADMQPYAPPAQIVKAAESRIKMLSQRGAQRHIVLLDREENKECPGEFSTKLSLEFTNKGYSNVSVVLKDRAFENWLVADLEAVAKSYGKRGSFADRIIDRVRHSGADRVNAIAILNGGIAEGYSKRSDAITICKAVSPEVVAKYSRSFRKFMKECGI